MKSERSATSLGRRAGSAFALRRQLAGFRRRVRPQGDVVSRLQQMPRHRIAHDSQTEKANLCHERILPVRPTILVTKHVFPETVAFLKQHAEVDYADTQDGLTSEELIARSAGSRRL